MRVTKTGQWQQANGTFDAAATGMASAINAAVTLEAHRARRECIQGISSGAPGGKKFTPLKETTKAVRRATRGTKKPLPMQETGEYKRAIVVESIPSEMVAFCGILRRAKTADGKSLANVAEVHEFGAGPFGVPITDKSRRFFFWAMAQGGLAVDQESSGAAAFVITIPARPVFGPVWDKMRSGSKKRIQAAIQQRLFGKYGRTPGRTGR
jgi:hypothetical protein